MISKNDLNSILVKDNYKNLIEVYVAILDNNPELPFPQKEFEAFREAKNFDNYVSLLRLRIRRGEDQKDDFCYSSIFSDVRVFFDKFNSNFKYTDYDTQVILGLVKSFFATHYGAYFPTAGFFAFLWSMAHINISENEYAQLCDEYFDLYEKMRSPYPRISCNYFYKEFFPLIKDRFPALAGDTLQAIIHKRLKRNIINPETLAQTSGRATFLSLLAEDVSAYSLEDAKNYLKRMLSDWIETQAQRTSEDMSWVTFIQSHKSHPQLLAQFALSEHWETLYSYIMETLITDTLLFVESEALKERFLRYHATPYHKIFNALLVLLRFKGVSENILLAWEDKMLSGMKARDPVSTEQVLKLYRVFVEKDNLGRVLECADADARHGLNKTHNILHGMQIKAQELPMALHMFLLSSNECDPDILLSDYEAFDSKEILYSHPKKLFYLLSLMGSDTFKVLKKFKEATSKDILEEFWKNTDVKDEYITQLKSIYHKNRDAILSEEKWREFCAILIYISNIYKPYGLKISDNLADAYYFFRLLVTDTLIERCGLIDQTVFDKKLSIFTERFQKVNAQVHNQDQNGRDISTLMRSYHKSMTTIASFAGVDTLTILGEYLTTSVMPLERLLLSLPWYEDLNHELIPLLQLLYKKYRHVIIHDKQHEAFFIAFSLMTTLQLFGLDKELFDTIDKSSTLNKLNEVLAQQLICAFLNRIGHPDEKINAQEAFQRVPLTLFSQLLRMRQRLISQRAPYLSLFDISLSEDLAGKKLVNKHAMDLAKQLDTHNQNIRAQLKNANINVDKAFHYNEMHDFSCGGVEGAVDELQIIKALWIDMNQLMANAERLKHTDIVKLLDDLQNSLLKKSEKAQGVSLTDNQAKEVFRKLKIISVEQKKSRLETLVAKLDRHIVAANDNTINEFFGHLKREATTLNALLIQKEQTNHYTPRKYFSIEMFDKSQPDTFALGTYVGCCLAPDGGHFNAMIQRRMDDAMFMHVVRDKATNKPVALNWLFFAKSTSDPQDIYVVANFFEMTASLANVSTYRNAIVEELKEFTGRYTQAIGAKAFIMNELTYGLIPDFTGYQQTPLKIEKVGGFLELNGQSEDYYLNSLYSERFHLFKTREPSATQHLLNLSSSSSSLTSDHVITNQRSAKNDF